MELWPLVSTRIAAHGQGEATIIAYGPGLGGLIVNPSTREGQGLGAVETLYVDMVAPPGLQAIGTTFAIEPGQSFSLPEFSGPVYANAPSVGHRFSGYVLQPDKNFKESEAEFPPAGYTTLTQTIPSYLYKQYEDDDDLQAFVGSYNAMAQQYVDWFVTIGLPIYTKDPISGPLLDWVAAGLYGMVRPALPSGLRQNVGPLNTYAFNTWALNQLRMVSSGELFTTTDDIFRRIITWHFYKGDGKVFDIRWLKRRIMRFLTGEDGTAGDTDSTYPVSVTFGANCEVNINLASTRRIIVGGAIFNGFMMNHFSPQPVPFNHLQTRELVFPVSPLAPLFKSAVDSGVLELPFQYKFIVNVRT